MINPKIDRAISAIDAALLATREAFEIASREEGHRVAMAKGQLSAALVTLARAKQFLRSSESGTLQSLGEKE